MPPVPLLLADLGGEPPRQLLARRVVVVEEPVDGLGSIGGPAIPVLGEVLGSDGVEVEIELGRRVSRVPEDVAEFLGHLSGKSTCASPSRIDFLYSARRTHLATHAEQGDHPVLLVELVSLLRLALVVTEFHTSLPPARPCGQPPLSQPPSPRRQ